MWVLAPSVCKLYMVAKSTSDVSHLETSPTIALKSYAKFHNLNPKYLRINPPLSPEKCIDWGPWNFLGV